MTACVITRNIYAFYAAEQSSCSYFYYASSARESKAPNQNVALLRSYAAYLNLFANPPRPIILPYILIIKISGELLCSPTPSPPSH